jgi:hypothetical protein
MHAGPGEFDLQGTSQMKLLTAMSLMTLTFSLAGCARHMSVRYVGRTERGVDFVVTEEWQHKTQELFLRSKSLDRPERLAKHDDLNWKTYTPIEFEVRGAANRIWLVDPQTASTLSAVDFDAARVWPHGTSQPPWAMPHEGTLMTNELPNR